MTLYNTGPLTGEQDEQTTPELVSRLSQSDKTGPTHSVRPTLLGVAGAGGWQEPGARSTQVTRRKRQASLHVMTGRCTLVWVFPVVWRSKYPLSTYNNCMSNCYLHTLRTKSPSSYRPRPYPPTSGHPQVRPCYQGRTSWGNRGRFPKEGS